MLVEVKNVSKSYRQGDGRIRALQPISFEVAKNETVAIVGPSGSGKTTLLSLLAGLEKPTDGAVYIGGENISTLDEYKLGLFRAKSMGIVFQQFHLMPHLTAFENVGLPLEILGERNFDGRIREALEVVGLGHRMQHLPAQLSGGEQQRVAIARALIHRPEILLADEPSGNLDVQTGHRVMDLIFDLAEKQNLTLLLVTHDTNLAARCRRQILLEGDKAK